MKNKSITQYSCVKLLGVQLEASSYLRQALYKLKLMKQAVWESHVHTRAGRNANYNNKPLSKSLTMCLGKWTNQV